jgi:competence protein ComFC
MWPLLRQVGKSFLDLLYPPLCLHCEEGLEEGGLIFCNSCVQQMVPIPPHERCPYCFSADFEKMVEKCCQTCRERPPLLERNAAVFDYEGPPATLVKQLKYAGQPYLAEGAAAYLAMQFTLLEWPLPDAIIPMPMAYLRRLERGYNQSLLLAQSLSALIDRPVRDVLKRCGGDFSQARLSYRHRLQLRKEAFEIKRDIRLDGQCLLLIDDVMTTGSSLRCCAEALLEGCPSSIYGLTVCKAI